MTEEREQELEKELREFFAAGRPAYDVPLPGRTLGDFQLLRPLGRGGMGIVFEALQAPLGRRVAVKILDGARATSGHARRRFEREARAAAALDHPNIVKVLSAGEIEGMPYLAMELVEGRTLEAVISALHGGGRGERHEPVPWVRGGDVVHEACRMMADIADAVAAAHSRGIVHRDLKPGNIMVRPDGTALVMDFGVAQAEEATRVTATGDVLGTVHYMSPEQVAGRAVDHRTDVYSLGATLYEFVTLRRPFDGRTREHVIARILTSDPVAPRQLNPRIPPDVETIILKAMAPDPGRRYQGAGELAADLRRFLSLEPIRARRAGPMERALRWMRRNPAKSVGLAAAVLLLLAGLGVIVDRTSARRRSALASAATAREEAVRKTREHDACARSVMNLQAEASQLRVECFTRFAPLEKRARLNGLERELDEAELRLDRLALEAEEALERAKRHEASYFEGGPGPETRAALLAHNLSRWKVAVRRGDKPAAEQLQAEVRRYDDLKQHEKTLLGRGTLTVHVEPADAEVYLFRYEDYGRIRRKPPVVSRLVPVPTRGVGRSRPDAWFEDFHPGDLCLEVVGVEPGSEAATAGLARGDLVIQVAGHPSGEGLLAASLSADGPAARAGVRPFDRIESIDDLPVEGWFEWRSRPPPDLPSPRVLVVGGKRVEGSRAVLDDETFGLRPAAPLDLVRDPAPARGLKLLCLSRGEPVSLEIQEGRDAGLRCEVTAYPLILSSECAVRGGESFDADPGSYLLVARRDGSEDQRFPLVVPRAGGAVARIRLRPMGSTPPGFVHVPHGPFVYGGDPLAFQARPREMVDLPGFCISRFEVTVRDWFEFVNSPEILDTILKARSEGRSIFLPRASEVSGPLCTHGEDGRWVPHLSRDSADLCVSRSDVSAYLSWRNRRAREAGEKWEYDLPTEQEWEKAARGVDGRFYPWGDRFDFSLVSSGYRKPVAIWDQPPGFEPRDESPYGVRDMAGSVSEWGRDPVGADSDLYPIHGGAAGNTTPDNFRCCIRVGPEPSYFRLDLGFRLLARPRGPG